MSIYTAEEVDWIAVYHATTDCGFCVSSLVFDGECRHNLRLSPPSNGQVKLIRSASDLLAPIQLDREIDGDRLPFPAPPE